MLLQNQNNPAGQTPRTSGLQDLFADMSLPTGFNALGHSETSLTVPSSRHSAYPQAVCVDLHLHYALILGMGFLPGTTLPRGVGATNASGPPATWTLRAASP